MQPIERFKDINQAVELLNEWKQRLGLFDWIIKVKLVEPHELSEDSDGECEYIKIIKSAVIRILRPKYYGDRIIKYCAEKILVHELLHCKLAMFGDDDGIEPLLHQTLDDIARALICAKYGITHDWFCNITYDGQEVN